MHLTASNSFAENIFKFMCSDFYKFFQKCILQKSRKWGYNINEEHERLYLLGGEYYEQNRSLFL